MYDNSVRMYAESLPQHCCHAGDWLAVLDGHRWGQFTSQAVSTFEVPVVRGVGGRLPQKSRLGVIVCITLCEASGSRLQAKTSLRLLSLASTRSDVWTHDRALDLNMEIGIATRPRS